MRRLLLLLLVIAGCASPRLGAYYPPSRGAWLMPLTAKTLACEAPSPAPKPHAPPIRHRRHRPVMADKVTKAPSPPPPLRQGRVEHQRRKLLHPRTAAAPTERGLGRMIGVLAVMLGLTILALVLALAFPGTAVGITGLVLLIVLFALVVVPLGLALLRH